MDTHVYVSVGKTILEEKIMWYSNSHLPDTLIDVWNMTNNHLQIKANPYVEYSKILGSINHFIPM